MIPGNKVVVDTVGGVVLAIDDKNATAAPPSTAISTNPKAKKTSLILFSFIMMFE